MRFTILALLLAMPAAAGDLADSFSRYKNGNALLDNLRGEDRKDAIDYMDGMAYIVGVHDTLSQLGLMCSPTEATQGQIAAVVRRHLVSHPEELHKSAAGLVTDAFYDASWGCPGGRERLRDMLIRQSQPDELR